MNDNQEKLKEQGKTTIWRPHDQKYRTSEWYQGTGEITHSHQELSFEVTATYQLKAKVKVVKGVFEISNSILADIYRPRGRCVAIVDQTVDQLYGKSIKHYFNAHEIPLELLSCRAWESDKKPDTVHKLLAFLGTNGCDVSRNEPVLVVGGGVLSDVAGLACALQHRRTPYVMIGTTVVAAIDAGPSPRTCVNGTQFKNSIGSYHPPVLTLVDRSFFCTLAVGHIRNGMAEIIKMAITDDLSLFELLDRKYGKQ